MAKFIHITDAKNLSSIRRNGIKLGKNRFSIPSLDIEDQRAIFAVPLTDNYEFNHQWMREIKRYKNFQAIAVQFSIPDEEIIIIGNYAQMPSKIKAQDAFNYVKDHNYQMGIQVCIFSKVLPSQIAKIYYPQKVVGWRYYPDAHGYKPSPYLQRGEPFSRNIKKQSSTREINYYVKRID